MLCERNMQLLTCLKLLLCWFVIKSLSFLLRRHKLCLFPHLLHSPHLLIHSFFHSCLKTTQNWKSTRRPQCFRYSQESPVLTHTPVESNIGGPLIENTEKNRTSYAVSFFLIIHAIIRFPDISLLFWLMRHLKFKDIL